MPPLLDLEGLVGHDDVLQSRVDYSNAALPRAVREAVPRTGGRWLSLVCGGYTLQLNSGGEASAVLAAARALDGTLDT